MTCAIAPDPLSETAWPARLDTMDLGCPSKTTCRIEAGHEDVSAVEDGKVWSGQRRAAKLGRIREVTGDVGVSILVEVLRAIVSQPAAGCRSSVLFSVRQQLAVGVAARGIATTGLVLQTLIVPLTAPSLLQRCFSERTALRGDFASDPMLTMISGYLGGISAQEALVAPLVLGERVFNLLCCASAPDKPFGPGAEMGTSTSSSALLRHA